MPAVGARGYRKEDKTDRFFIRRKGKIFAQVVKYSKNVVVVKLLRQRAIAMMWRYYEVLVSFVVNRSPLVDRVFTINEFNKTLEKNTKTSSKVMIVKK